MKYAAIMLLLSLIALPTLGNLTDTDLDKIRLIVKDEVKAEVKESETRMKTYVDNQIRLLLHEELRPIQTDITSIKEDVATLKGRIDGIDKLITWLIAIIVLVFGAPQVIALWRSSKTDKEQEKINQELREKIEMLEKQRIQTP